MLLSRGVWRLRAAAVVCFVSIVSTGSFAETAPCNDPAPQAQPDAAAAGFSPEKLDKISDYFNHEVTGGKIPGAIVLIQRHGKPVYFRCFGVRDVDTNIPMSADTIFRIFSMTKPITATLTMMLVDQGRIKLDDPLSKYIPSFADVKVGVEVKADDGTAKLDLVPLERPITIEDMLRQSSGITYGFYGESLVRTEYKKADLFSGNFDNASFAERVSKLPLAEQPATLWDYGHSMDVMGRVIEVISGQSLYKTERAMLLDPLGMTDTSYFVADPAKLSLIAEPLPNDKTFVSAMERNIRLPVAWEAGGSGLVSTVGDYCRFAQMLLNGGNFEGKHYLSAETVKNMTSNHIAPATSVKRGAFYFPGDGFGYGLGFGVRIDRGDHDPPGSIGEYKWDGAGGTYFFVDPKLDIVMVFMVQTPSERGRIQPDLKKMIYDAVVQ
jgi:CubicO group peptidase (beta-lactamase class C family)